MTFTMADQTGPSHGGLPGPGDRPSPTTRRRPPGPRLLAGLATGHGAVALAEHRRNMMKPPVPTADPQMRLIDLVGTAGLTGRGGAGFPTGRKMAAVGAGRGPRAVVVNATEGEPASRKDALLLARLPHLVLDGAVVAAAAVGASEVHLACDRTAGAARNGLEAALAERAQQEPLPVPVILEATPPRYVAGEETALVQWINGGPAKPTTGERPFRRGVGRGPTLVQNAETLAHLAQISAYGAEWFRSTGTPEEPGTRLVSISGAVERPGVIEAAAGTLLSSLVKAARPTEPIRALLVGGFFGTWVGERPAASAPYSRAGLAPLGAGPGAGVVVVLPRSGCGLAETARILAWYAAESAGQCGPCVFGLPDLAGGFCELASGRGASDLPARLRRWADQVDGRGGCKHPDGAVRLMRSALDVFAEDVDRHARGEPCRGPGSPVVEVPSPSKGWR